MKRIVVLVVLVIIALPVLVGCGGGGGGTSIVPSANAAPPTVFNVGVKKQIYIAYGDYQGATVTVYNTSSQLESDGSFLSFTDNTGDNFYAYNYGVGSIPPPANYSQVGISNQIVIPVSRILRIVQYQ